MSQKIDRRGFLAAVAALPLAGAVEPVRQGIDLNKPPIYFRGRPIYHVNELSGYVVKDHYQIFVNSNFNYYCNNRRRQFVFTQLKIPTVKRRWLEYEDLPRRCRLPELFEDREGWI